MPITDQSSLPRSDFALSGQILGSIAIPDLKAVSSLGSLRRSERINRRAKSGDYRRRSLRVVTFPKTALLKTNNLWEVTRGTPSRGEYCRQMGPAATERLPGCNRAVDNAQSLRSVNAASEGVNGKTGSDKAGYVTEGSEREWFWLMMWSLAGVDR